VVGNGVPSARYAGCAITAGRPCGQRTATAASPRGGRPSWKAMAA